jgi:hypothetical protein
MLLRSDPLAKRLTNYETVSRQSYQFCIQNSLTNSGVDVKQNVHAISDKYQFSVFNLKSNYNFCQFTVHKSVYNLKIQAISTTQNQNPTIIIIIQSQFIIIIT